MIWVLSKYCVFAVVVHLDYANRCDQSRMNYFSAFDSDGRLFTFESNITQFIKKSILIYVNYNICHTIVFE